MELEIKQTESRSKQLTADGLLLAVTLVWGTTFVAVKNALADIGPYWFIGVRFAIAFACLSLIYYRRMFAAWSDTGKLSVTIGFTLFTGFILQTIGLQYTTASNSGFITGLSVVLVPLVGRFWGQPVPGMATKLGIGCAVAGLALLTLKGDLTVNIGDLYTLLATIAFAAHIVMVSYYAPRTDAVSLAIWQIGAVALAGVVGGFMFESFPDNFSDDVWLALAVTAIPATAVAFLVQNTVQKYTTSTRTAIIFALEPVFAGLAAYIFLGEILTVSQILGCTMIVVGMLISELG